MPNTILYICSGCSAQGVKLWRRFNTFTGPIMLLCAACSCESQLLPNDVDDMGESIHGHSSSTDTNIGSFVRAIPTEEGDTFWGHTVVPHHRIIWWISLPTREGE